MCKSITNRTQPLINLFSARTLAHILVLHLCVGYSCHKKMPQSTQKNISSTPIDFKLKKVTRLFKPLSRTFQGCMEFKDFPKTPSKIQGLFKTVRNPSPTIAVFGHFYGPLFSVV